MQVLTDDIAVLIVISMLGGALLVVSSVLIKIRNRSLLLRKNQELQDAELNNQKNMLYATIASQEKERERIGMDLHDDVGSQLSWLRLLIESNQSGLPGDAESLAFTAQSKIVIDRIIATVRSIAHDLSPRVRDMTGLLDGLEDIADRLNRSGAIRMTLQADDGSAGLQIDAGTALGLYRIIAELVNNTIKHADASRIELSLEHTAGMLRIFYFDDGIGLPGGYTPGTGGRGMQNIASRVKMMGGAYRLAGAATTFRFQVELPVTAGQF